MKKRIILSLLILIGVVCVIIALIKFVYPELNKDWDLLYEQEKISQEKKFEEIKADLNQSLKYNDATVNLGKEYIEIHISGKYCDLNATLTRDLDVTNYTVLNNKDKLTLPYALAMAFGIISSTLGVIYVVYSVIKMRKIARENRLRKLEAKTETNILV